VSVGDASSRAVSGPVDDAAEDAAVGDTAGGAAVGGVADATHRPISGSVDDAADGGALDQAPGKAEDQPRSAPTNGHTDAADSDSASTNGSGYADPAVVAARGEADPR
jgi:hypothetical protein